MGGKQENGRQEKAEEWWGNNADVGLKYPDLQEREML